MSNRQSDQQTITLQNKISDSTKLSEFFTTFAKTNEISGETFHDLKLVVEEIFVNITSYAYTKELALQNITINLSYSPNEISVTFIDSGVAFNPLSKPTKSKDSNQFSEGGMGLHLITSLTDGQKYNRVHQTNEFTVTKHYTQ